MSGQITAEMISLTHGGACIGRITQGDPELIGAKAFIRGTVAGETVRAEITHKKKNFVEADLIQVITPSSSRRQPPCQYVGSCGGCDLQHMTVSEQRSAKRKMVEDSFRIHLGTLPLHGVELCGTELPEFGYRSRVSLHLNQHGEVGFFRPKSGDIVQINECLISSDVINIGIKQLREIAPKIAHVIGGVVIEEINKSVVFVLKVIPECGGIKPEIQHIASKHFANVRILDREREIFSQYVECSEQSEELKFASHFSQVNQKGNLILQEQVLSHVTMEQVTELYAGAGNFSLLLGKLGKTVRAVEIDPALVKLGTDRARHSGLDTRVSFVCLSVEKFMQREKAQGTLLLDPPRSGAREVAERLDLRSVEEIVYVSCSLPTLTRDLKSLISRGYTFEGSIVVDMFSQTHHVETVNWLKKSR